MSYQECESALLATLQSISDIDPDGISLGDFSVLNYGFNKAIVIEGGVWSREMFTGLLHVTTQWQMSVKIFVQYANDVQFHGDMISLRQDVLDIVAAFPNLGNANAVFNAEFVSGTPLSPLIEEGGTTFLAEELICVIQENN